MVDLASEREREKKYKCEKCDKSFNRSDKLKIHVNSCRKKPLSGARLGTILDSVFSVLSDSDMHENDVNSVDIQVK